MTVVCTHSSQFRTHTPATQFEPESFVDGLLGIGASGGKSESEGQALADRLAKLRKERDSRALAKSKAKPPRSPELTSDPITPEPELELAGVTPGGSPNRSSNKNKKKKRKRRKK